MKLRKPPCVTMISAAATTSRIVATTAAAACGGGGIGLPMGGGGLGIGTIIVLGLVSYAFGIDPRILIGGAEILTGGEQLVDLSDRSPLQFQRKTGAPTDEMGSMIAGILGEIDDRWSEVFQAAARVYTGPKIVLFRNVTNGGRCGMAQSAMGPFYCPPDRKIFLDTGFFREVETRFRGCSGSACKFTAAYIIAHEAGHHVQNLLGIIPRVTQAAAGAGSKAEANALQVRVELQADCLSGVWVNREQKKRPNFLEAGDIDAALTTASAIGDDTLAAPGHRARGARLLHPRLGRAAQAMVHDRLSAGHAGSLQHLCIRGIGAIAVWRFRSAHAAIFCGSEPATLDILASVLRFRVRNGVPRNGATGMG